MTHEHSWFVNNAGSRSLLSPRCVRMSTVTVPHRVMVLLVAGAAVMVAMGWDTEPLPAEGGRPPERSARVSGLWSEMISEAAKIGLPTRFLRRMDQDFVEIEFEDLRSFAAEYHPAHHRMVLNRSLSFHAAGRTLKPLSRLPNRDLGTLYHELFHAYVDFIRFSTEQRGGDPLSARLLKVARRFQECRYRHVLITPVVQRQSSTEQRMLTERESWEALNETWAVFVGWAAWTILELRDQDRTTGTSLQGPTPKWLRRLQHADQDALLTGYYEPQDLQERVLTQKRYLAPSYRITPPEIALLLEVVFEQTPRSAATSATAAAQSGAKPATRVACP